MTDKNLPAAQDEMNAMHAELAAAYRDQLRQYRDGEVLDTNGNPKPAPANLLTSYAKFLKDNRIDTPSQSADEDDELARRLDEIMGDPDDTVVPFGYYTRGDSA